MFMKSITLTISIIATLSLVPILQAGPSDEPIAIYAFYTASHKEMVENWFLPSLENTQNNDYKLILECHEQECPGGSYMNTGWMKTMHHKIDIILRGIHECWGGIFVHSDIDIQYFKPIKEIIIKALEDKDFVGQRDDPRGNVCAGFFACRANEATLELWQTIKQMVTDDPSNHDQAYLNGLLLTNRIKGLRWDYLPVTFFGGGTLARVSWYPGRKLPVPKDIVLHHANYTVGVQNKIKQLAYVKSVVESRACS